MNTETNLHTKRDSDLLQENATFKRLIEITEIINASLDMAKLLNAVMEAIKDIMKTDASSLLFYDEKSDELVFKVALGEAGGKLSEKYRVKSGVGIVGYVARTKKSLVVNNAYSDPRFNPEFDKMTGFETRNIICSPLLFKGKLIGVIEGINTSDRRDFTDSDIILFETFSHLAVMAVQNAILLQKSIDEKIIRKEFEQAQILQDELSDIKEETPGLEIRSIYIPVKEIKGEFCLTQRIDETHSGITVCDAGKKGIPGGISASYIMGGVRSLSKLYGKHPLTLAKTMHSVVSGNLSPFSRTAYVHGVYRKDVRTFDFVKWNDIHIGIIRDGSFREFNIPAEQHLSEAKLNKHRISMKINDIIIIYSNGLAKISNKFGHEFGSVEMTKAIMESSKFDDLLTNIASQAMRFSEGTEQREDITILAFRVTE